MWMRTGKSLLAAPLAGLVLAAGLCGTAAADKPSADWERAIQAFEAADRQAPPPTNAVLFAGSSRIRIWTTLTNDFAGMPVIQRGFGGSQMVDLLVYADRIILPYQPSVLVVYEGDNDVAAGKSPEQILADYQRLVGRVHERLPRTCVMFIAVKPSRARWQFIDQIRRTNQLIEDFSKQDPRLYYVDVFAPMLDGQGQPREELFVKDQLHLNADGYRLWTKTLDPVLRELVAGPPANSSPR
jgi:hypothetical protein